MAASVPEQDMVVMAMVLDESDLPGACLMDPMDQHTKSQLYDGGSFVGVLRLLHRIVGSS